MKKKVSDIVSQLDFYGKGMESTTQSLILALEERASKVIINGLMNDYLRYRDNYNEIMDKEVEIEE
jgi:hypothetical protein